MKFLRLLPEQIMAHWEGIKNCVWNALPPITYDSDETILRVQERLLTGRMQCWIAAEDLNSVIIYAIATTQIIVDDISGEKNLLIFSLATLVDHPASLWEEAYEVLKRFAASRGCLKIVAYTCVPQVVLIAERLGARIDWRYLQFPI